MVCSEALVAVIKSNIISISAPDTEPHTVEFNLFIYLIFYSDIFDLEIATGNRLSERLQGTSKAIISGKNELPLIGKQPILTNNIKQFCPDMQAN